MSLHIVGHREGCPFFGHRYHCLVQVVVPAVEIGKRIAATGFFEQVVMKEAFLQLRREFFIAAQPQRFYPIIKEMNLRFRRPATGDICVEARLTDEQIQHLQKQATEAGKAEYVLELQLTDDSGEVVAQSRGVYQLRAR